MSRRLYQVGLTGGIGSGKSLAAEHLATKGIPVLNLDEIGRELMRTDLSLVKKVHEVCGVEAESFQAQLVKDRIFALPTLRHTVEAILHPAIFAAYEERARAQNRLVICEAALLYESNYYRNLDEVILIVAPLQRRKERVLQRQGMTEPLFDKIDQSQWSDDKKCLLAKTVIHNDQSFDMMREQLDRIVLDWQEEGLL